jgi:hypothetical protein
MAITTLDGLIAAARQHVTYTKTASVTAVAAQLTAVHQAAGNPGAATLAVGNTANGLVPTDATVGWPLVNTFGGGALGYLAGLQYVNSVASNLIVYDRLFHAGAYAFNANVTLASQPSFAGRVPGGTDFTGLELWVEAVTAFTGNLSIAVTYTNQSGTAGRTTGTVATGIAPAIARIIMLPLQAGDSGIQQLNSVVATVSTVGTFNLVVVRRLATLRVPVVNVGGMLGFDVVGLPQVFDTSALTLAVQPDSTATGLPFVKMLVANG